jgi:CheY-like chemotaxis protein
VDVIVLDVNLPDVHALEACRRITQVSPDIKGILFTAIGEPDACAESARRRTRRQ